METEKNIKQVTSSLMESFFAEKSFITGNEILSFSKVKQINLFILYMLMQEWKENIDEIKTPFFDYDHEDVKDALQSYMNTVSKHIKVGKIDFEPLVVNAVNYSFQLAKNPESFVVSNHLESKLQELNKYIVLHKAYFDGDKDYEVEDQLPALLAKLGISSKTDKITSEPKPDETINDKIVNEQPKTSVLDKFSTPEVGPKINIKKIENIKNAITINQRFIFINELFNGDAAQYDQIITRLENCTAYETASNILAEILSDDVENEAAGQLFLLIQQKYNFSAE